VYTYTSPGHVYEDDVTSVCPSEESETVVPNTTDESDGPEMLPSFWLKLPKNKL
jgi:hypothetical protein